MKADKKKRKLRHLPKNIHKFFKLTLKNIISLHHKVWGKGWKRFLIALGITLTIITAVMVLSMEVTSRPKFCSTCHYMIPYYASWQNSSHKDVTCTDCHFPPGIKSKIKGKFTALSMVVNYFTGVYKKSKPWAEISDESCMRSGCHETRALSGEVTFKKDIIFDHAPHIKDLRRGKKLRCTSCHSQIVQGNHISVTESSCFLCHFKDTGKDAEIHQCRKCHEPPVTSDKNEKSLTKNHAMILEKEIACQKCHGEMIIGDGAVPKNRCDNCHAETEKLKHYNDTNLIHKNHITDHKIECLQCHTEIQHKSVSRTESIKPDCHACHPDYHEAQLDLFVGRKGKGIPNHPSPMFETGLNCQACHIYHRFSNEFPEAGQTFIANAESCEPCHGKGYNKILQNWVKQTRQKITGLDSVLLMADRIIQNNRTKKNYFSAKKKLDDAHYNHNLVRFGNAIHNIVFATKLLEKANQFAVEAVAMIDPTAKLPAFEKTAHLVPGECSNCHTGIERTETKIFGWNFPHFNHLIEQNLTCRKCHSNERQHGQLIIKKDDCMSCHHKDKELKCLDCHKTQNSIYLSSIKFSTLKIPNVMAEDVTCLDCHEDNIKHVTRSTKETCSKCHEKDYEDFFDQWQQTSFELLSKLRDKVIKEKLTKGTRAYDILNLLEKDGSKGIHNPELYEKLINETLE